MVRKKTPPVRTTGGPASKNLPTSGSETPYTPGMFPRRRGNCYGFALNKTSMNEKLQPGDLAGRKVAMGGASPSSSCAAITNKMRKDAKASGRMYETCASSKCSPGYYKIASVVAPGNDFHYFRQMGHVTFRHSPGASRGVIAKAFGVPPGGVTVHRNGTATVRHSGSWAHKRGLATGALLQDACGKPILDPRKACTNYGNGLDYRKFCGFFCVKAKKTVAPSASAGKKKVVSRARG